MGKKRDNRGGHLLDFSKYVVVSAQFWVQYAKYFPSFSGFAIYFTTFKKSEMIKKYEKPGKYLSYCTRLWCHN